MKHIYIAGAGGIGRALGLILLHFRNDVTITFVDKHQSALDACGHWFEDADVPHEYIRYERNDFAQLDKGATEIDVVADCLPGAVADKVAIFALNHQAHYINLTEHVAATRQIQDLAKGASTAFVLQCGLAPGYINVLACACFEKWKALTGKDEALEMTMRVGALSQHVEPPSYYAFTWSPIGVATEYVKPSIVVENHKLTEKPSLGGLSTRRIFGHEYEEALTSGGAASLPEYYKSSIQHISYKTLRYPGHFDYVLGLLEQDDKQQPSALLRAMTQDIPLVQADKVILYANVKGYNAQGVLEAVESALEISGKSLAGKHMKAIQTTTAGAMAQILTMLLDENIVCTGPVFQHQINTKDFLEGKITKFFYES